MVLSKANDISSMNWLRAEYVKHNNNGVYRYLTLQLNQYHYTPVGCNPVGLQ